MATSGVLSVFILFTFVSLISVQRIVAEPQTTGLLARENESSGRANYTVSFVPLISVIANFLPRFLTRFNPQVTQARGHIASAGTEDNAATAVAAAAAAAVACDQFLPNGLRWPDPRNPQQFLYCYPDPVCVLLSQKTGSTSRELKCYTLQAEKCPPNTEFRFNEQRCS